MNTKNLILDNKIKLGIDYLENGNLAKAEKIFKKLKKNKQSQVIGLFF